MTVVDFGVVAVVLLSAVLAFIRGFVVEVLSIGAWVGAALVTLYAYPEVHPFVHAELGPPLLADAATVGGLFVASLVVLMVFSHFLAKLIKGSALSAIDRSLGFLFGVFRGAVLVVVAYLLASWLVPPEDHPAWIKEARSRPLAEAGAALLRDLIPDQLQFGPAGDADAAQGDALPIRQAEEDLRARTVIAPRAGSANPVGDTGYGVGERRELDRLIDNVN